MNVSFQGIDELVVTFQVSGEVNQGDFVFISDNGTVSPSTFGDIPAGKVLNVRDGFAAVQVRGAMETEYSGGLHLGMQNITAQGGKIMASNSGDNSRNAMVLSKDDTTMTACLLLW